MKTAIMILLAVMLTGCAGPNISHRPNLVGVTDHYKMEQDLAACQEIAKKVQRSNKETALVIGGGILLGPIGGAIAGGMVGASIEEERAKLMAKYGDVGWVAIEKCMEEKGYTIKTPEKKDTGF